MGTIADYVLKSIPDAPVAVKSILSSVWMRAVRDWAETPAPDKEKLKTLKKKKRLEEIRRLAEARIKK
jgi:cytochrome bd-type quinol oxidase subunit 1